MPWDCIKKFVQGVPS